MGVHSGLRSRVRVEPAPWGAGLVVVVRGVEIPVGIGSALAVPGSTVLVGDGVELHTPEHLLAALVGAGVTDATIAVDGPERSAGREVVRPPSAVDGGARPAHEVPVLDGSSREWCAALADVGLGDGPTVEPLRLPALRIEAHGGVAEVWPCATAVAEVSVDFGSNGPRGEAGVTLVGDAFCREVAWARTFALRRDVDRLLAAGRGRGATAENTVIWGPAGAEGRLRAPDEPVRHKLLDLVGDLALLGRSWVGRVRVERGSHALHHALVRALVDA